MLAHELMGRIGDVGRRPRFVIFSSYGNDSVALIQWAYEEGLSDVVVVFSDTGWAADWWKDRVDALELWVHKLGFWTDRTTSIGFVALAHHKKAFPTQQFQWCSYILKIEPSQRWLAEADPDRRAVCLVGVRRDEGQDRANFPRYHVKSVNHGGRVMIAPFADDDEDRRNGYLQRAGVEPLPHRSMECSPCINSNRADIRALTPAEVSQVRAVETDMTLRFGLTRNGKPRTLFRPHRHMGAVGIDEVKRWADLPRGQYRPPEPPDEPVTEDEPPEEDVFNACNNGYCAN